jgi:D-sedoheptulose 7-phosphate isomerase
MGRPRLGASSEGAVYSKALSSLAAGGQSSIPPAADGGPPEGPLTDAEPTADAPFTRLAETALEAHGAVLARTRAACLPALAELTDACLAALRGDGKLLLFGNGGSAADAQHLATELAVRFSRIRAPMAALALTTDTSVLTAAGNDMGFEQVFARQVEALGRPGDVALGISTSGHSPNVLAGLAMARERGLVAVGLAGRGGGAMVGLADPLVVVPDEDTARIQEMHILLGHILCVALEEGLGLVPGGGP